MDVLQYNWHNLRRETEILLERVRGGRSAIVWGAISYEVKVDLVGKDGKMELEYYVNILQNVLLSMDDMDFNEDWILQQDNSSVRISIHVKEFLDANDIDVMERPDKFPDINIIKNVWGHPAGDSFNEERQYEDIVDLQDGIMESGQNLNLEH